MRNQVVEERERATCDGEGGLTGRLEALGCDGVKRGVVSEFEKG